MPSTEMTEQQLLGYFAGIIDGEGCIGIHDRGGHNGLTLRVSVTNTDPRIVHLLKRNFGGSISSHSMQKYCANAKDAFVWDIAGKKAEFFLRAIFPCLVLKKERAELALQFRELLGPWGGGKVISAEALAERRAIALKLKGLNKKGISDASY